MAKKRNNQLKTSVPEKSQDKSHVRTINLDKLHHKKPNSETLKKNERLKPNFKNDTFTIPVNRTYNTYMKQIKNGTFDKDKAWKHHKAALKTHVVYEPIQDSDKIQRVMHKTFVDANIPVTKARYSLTGKYTSADKSPVTVMHKPRATSSYVSHHQELSSTNSQSVQANNTSSAKKNSTQDINSQVHVKKSDSRPVIKIHMPNLHVPSGNNEPYPSSSSASILSNNANNEISTDAKASHKALSTSTKHLDPKAVKDKQTNTSHNVSSSNDIDSMIKLIESGKTLSEVETMGTNSLSQSQASVESSESMSRAQAAQSQASFIASSQTASSIAAKRSKLKSQARSQASAFHKASKKYAQSSSASQSLSIPNVNSLSIDSNGNIMNYRRNGKTHSIESNVYSAATSTEYSQNNSAALSSDTAQSSNIRDSKSNDNNIDHQAPGLSSVLASAKNSSTSKSTSASQNDTKLGFFKRHFHPIRYHRLKKQQVKQSLASSARNSVANKRKASLSNSKSISSSMSAASSASIKSSEQSVSIQARSNSVRAKKAAKSASSIGTINFPSGETGSQMFKQAKAAYQRPNAGNVLTPTDLRKDMGTSINTKTSDISTIQSSTSTKSFAMSTGSASHNIHRININWSVLSQTPKKVLAQRTKEVVNHHITTSNSVAQGALNASSDASLSSSTSSYAVHSAYSNNTSKYTSSKQINHESSAVSATKSHNVQYPLSSTASTSTISASTTSATSSSVSMSTSASASASIKTDYQKIEQDIYNRKLRQYKHKEHKIHVKLRKQFKAKIARHNHAKKLAQEHRERVLTHKAKALNKSAASLKAKQSNINSDLTQLHGSWSASNAKSSAAKAASASSSRAQMLMSLKDSYAASYSSAKSVLTSSYATKMAVLSGYKKNTRNLNSKLTKLYQQSADTASQMSETSAQKFTYSKRADSLNQQIKNNSIQYSKASSAAQSSYQASLASNSTSFSKLNKANHSRYYHKMSALKHQLQVSSSQATSATKHASKISQKWQQAQKSLNIDKENNNKKIKAIKTKLILSRRSEANGHVAQVKAARLRKALKAALSKQVTVKANLRKAQDLVKSEKQQAQQLLSTERSKTANAKESARQTRIESNRRIRKYKSKSRQLINVNKNNSKILQMASHNSGQIKLYQQKIQKAQNSYRHLWNIYQRGMHEVKNVESIRLKSRRAYTMAHSYYIDNKKGRKKNARLQNALKSQIKDSKQNMQNMAETERILKGKIKNQTDTIALKNKRIRLIQRQINRYRDMQMGINPDNDPAVNGEKDRQAEESKPINMNQYTPSHHFDNSHSYQHSSPTSTSKNIGTNRPHREPSRINRHKHHMGFAGLNKIFEAHKHNYGPDFYYKKAEVGDDVKSLIFIKKYAVLLPDGRKMVFSRGNIIPTYGIISGPKKARYKTRFLIKNDQSIPALKSLVSLHR